MGAVMEGCLNDLRLRGRQAMSNILKMLKPADSGTAPPGQQEYITAQSTNWVCPAGVTSVSVVCIGGGASCFHYNDGENDFYPGGGAGALAYVNNYAVTPGTSYGIVVGTGGGLYNSGGLSSFNGTTCKANGGSVSGSTAGGVGGTVSNGTGFSGGAGGAVTNPGNLGGGGGAGGYSAVGGAGGIGRAHV